jgi:predicted RNA binding protein YcfA (HicA-like mRNA interferase family)
MSRMPTVTSRQLAAALRRLGFVDDTQRGSHLTLRHPVTRRRAMVPIHAGDLKRPLVKGILKDAGISEDEFIRHL